jgi:hypothetical protein
LTVASTTLLAGIGLALAGIALFFTQQSHAALGQMQDFPVGDRLIS